ncbi:hypothetical protein QP027_06830 [Corynebacterium breve]|uniref:Uncharacterized protein n=1 Tax=Corynebacterium breve TaxID=3049799 RepID=A0ABY8VDZ3_9CORY|nr:hypothetical protein [Corynebacterium breve]WIM66848.1 hypothetical protein QP027_06830 [Corynebacterium breve]
MKPKHFYIAGTVVLLATFGYLSMRLDDLGTAPFPLAFGAMIMVYIAVLLPPSGLAYVRGEVPADSPIPFSESLAQRIAANLDNTQLWIAKLGCFLACAIAFSALTDALPGWQKYSPVSFAVGALGTVGFSLALIVAMVSAYSKNKKRFPQMPMKCGAKNSWAIVVRSAFTTNRTTPWCCLFLQ